MAGPWLPVHPLPADPTGSVGLPVAPSIWSRWHLDILILDYNEKAFLLVCLGGLEENLIIVTWISSAQQFIKEFERDALVSEDTTGISSKDKRPTKSIVGMEFLPLASRPNLFWSCLFLGIRFRLLKHRLVLNDARYLPNIKMNLKKIRSFDWVKMVKPAEVGEASASIT